MKLNVDNTPAFWFALTVDLMSCTDGLSEKSVTLQLTY